MFSIIVPVYNKLPHLRRCLSSIHNQTYRNYEIIIVCDPSTDGSTEEIETLKEVYPEMVVLVEDAVWRLSCKKFRYEKPNLTG